MLYIYSNGTQTMLVKGSQSSIAVGVTSVCFTFSREALLMITSISMQGLLAVEHPIKKQTIVLEDEIVVCYYWTK